MIGEPPKSIVHPTDLSFASQEAFAHALRIAVATQGVLHLLHIEAAEQQETDDWDRFPHVREMLARWRMIEPAASRAEVAEKLGVQFVKATVESASPVQGVAAYVTKHLGDLMVLMTHNRSGLERWLEESVAEEAVRETRAPALFLREDQTGFIDRETGKVKLDTVLMPVEASVPPLDAFRHIADFAHALNPAADIMLLHVGDDLPIFDGLLPHIELRKGAPVETILSYATEIGADLIAMPTQGRRGLLDALRGSTTERVLRGAPCPVYAVPAK
ncbi:universal stress protein [Methylocystis parvus]|uniref:Universal stress protein n=1 Tax=Methylocystis parvus TaxID=134 RepID=A0A6B8M885_9HYPH|nr:universal stress protein [Methylocystis parvus]QGM96950.1 universal stress protein [Methylocystis parvus]WBJ99163.1 universal stress protein [Methylocystis parvus OBBP]